MRKRDKLGGVIDESSHRSNINSLILDDGIYDPQEIAKILLERGMRSNEKKGYWTLKPESEFDMMMNRVLTHSKFLRDEKRQYYNVKFKMKKAGYNNQEINDRIEWIRSVIPEPAEYCRNNKNKPATDPKRSILKDK